VSSRAEATAARPARWPWYSLAVFAAIAVAGLILVVANGESTGAQVPYVVAFTMFGVVGALILSRSRRNVIGRLLLLGAVVTASGFLAGELTTWLIESGRRGPGVVIVAFVSNLSWLFGILPVILLIPLLFPDGHLPSRRWRPFPWFIVGILIPIAVGFIFGERTLTGSNDEVGIANPLYLDAVGSLPSLDPLMAVLFPAIFAASVTSLFLRFRRSTGVERQQIKWVAFGFTAAFVGITISDYVLADYLVLSAVVGGAAFLAFPLSVGASVLQYRLYDLDVVVKKTLVAGTLGVVVVLVYGAVGVYGLVAAEGESSTSVFVVALLLGLAFRPVTRFARGVADRIVYGRRATPYEVLTEFSERMGEAYATQDVLSRMAQILAQGSGAESARVWLRVGQSMRPAASWPSATPSVEPVAAAGDALPELPGEVAVEVRDGGELLGAISVTMPANDPMSPAKERLVRDLASQAGLVLRNAGLVEELRASQRRLVAARDEERRRLERNIHDGSQQQLVALSVQTRLARGLLDRDPAKADEMLARIESDLQTALEDLRDLARGIYPPLLADKGLGPALEAQARRSPVPVTVEAPGIGRFSQEVEAAVYFSCLEALQNVAKYAEATAARVTLAQDDGHLTFEVIDDGHGFDLDVTSYGMGLQGIADRLAALDGELLVRSRPREGTSVTGTLDVGGRAVAGRSDASEPRVRAEPVAP